MFEKVRATAKNTLLYSLSNFIGKFSGVILLPLYTSSLSAELFGLFALFEVVFQVIQASTALGLKSALMRWYWDSEHKDHQKQIFFTTFCTYGLVNLLSAGILFSVFHLLAQHVFQTPISFELKSIFILSTFIRLIVDMLLLLMRIQHKALKHTNYQVLQVVLFVLGVALFLPVLKLEVLGIFLAFLLSYSVLLVMLLPYIRQNIEWRFRKDILTEMMSFGLPLALSNMVNLILSLSDKLIINFFGTLKHVGNYTMAFKISNIVQLVVVSAFMNSYTHVYFKGMDDADNKRLFSRIIIYLILTLSLISLGLVLFIEDVVLVLTLNNADYLDSIQLIPVLTLSLIFGGMRAMLTLPLSKYKKTKVISLISICAGLVNVGLNILMVPVWGSLGAAISTLIVQVIAVIMIWQAVRRIENEVLNVLSYLKILAVTIVLGSYIYLNVELMWIVEAFIKLGIVGVWMLLIWNIGIFEEVEKMRIRQAIEKWKNIGQFRENIKSLKK